MVKTPPANAGDIRDRGLIPWLRGSLGGGHGNTFQYSCLEKEEPGRLQSMGLQRVSMHMPVLITNQNNIGAPSKWYVEYCFANHIKIHCIYSC